MMTDNASSQILPEQSRTLIWGFSLTVAAVLAYGIYWLWLAVGLVHGVNDWIGGQAALGVKSSYASVKLGGFPFRVMARLSAPEIESSVGHWQGETLIVSVTPFSHRRLRLVLHGTNHLTSAGRSWDIASNFIRTDLQFDDDAVFFGLKSFQVTAGDIRWVSDRNVHASIEGFGLSILAMNHEQTEQNQTPTASSNQTPTASFVITVAGVNLPSAENANPLIPVALIEARGRVMGDFAEGVSFQALHPAEALQGWSQKGGVVDFDRVVADWPPVAVQGEGTLALDNELQPLASFSTQFRGMGQLTDELVHMGSIDEHAAALLRTSFADSAKSDGKGHLIQMVPLTMQNGKIWLGPVALASMPKINWPLP